MTWDFRVFDPSTFRPPARRVTRMFLHCTDSDNELLQGVPLVEEVNRWHLANGWAGIGYHFIVDKIGQMMTCRPLELTPAAQLGEIPLVTPDMVHMGNIATIAISTHGSKIFTPAALKATYALLRAIDAAYVGQRLRVQGHCEIDPRPCPVYPYKDVHGIDAQGFLKLDHAGPLDNVGIEAQHTEADWPKLAIREPHPVVPYQPRMLSEGCKGDDVKAAQHALGITETGIFDRWMYSQVIAFQSAHKLVPDGWIGPLTRGALGLHG